MRAEATLELSWLFGFLLTLARVGGVITFVPLPGFRHAPDLVRAVAALALTMALWPLWPVPAGTPPDAGTMALWLLAEAALGVTVGLAVSFLVEAFVVACQVLGLQAGYSYASTIDPTNNADSSVLQVFGQLTGSLLLLALGLDRQILRAFARSLETFPPGRFAITPAAVAEIVELGAGMFSTALRLALPLIALSMLVDVALALLGRLNGQLQLLTLAFPAKMLAALAMLSSIAFVFPALFSRAAAKTLTFLFALAGGF